MTPPVNREGRHIATGIAIALLCLTTNVESGERPNILLIVADDLGWGDVSYPQLRARGNRYEGSEVVKTPNLERMAQAGIRLCRFYAASPVCSPTRASLLTGRHGRRHRIDGPLFLESEGKLRNRELTIAELAQACGYQTGHFGKWHVGSLTKHVYDMRRGRVGNYLHHSAPWHNGYGTVFACENWMPTFAPYAGFPTNKAAQAAYFTGRSTPDLSGRVSGSDPRVGQRHESEIVADAAARFIEKSAKNADSFFATVWFSTPHVPLAETPITDFDHLGLSDERRRYCEAIAAMDAQIGRLRELLRELGAADDTLILFTSDNGPNDLNVGSTVGLRG
ncbi:MAG: sulfatase-like hydrolase/transferase, partial [Planctomycetota bacterium]